MVQILEEARVSTGYNVMIRFDDGTTRVAHFLQKPSDVRTAVNEFAEQCVVGLRDEEIEANMAEVVSE